MSRVMMLVSAEGATLAETRAGDGPEAERLAEGALRDEAITSGFSKDEVGGARLVIVGDFAG